MKKLWTILFGWEYVAVTTGMFDQTYIRRIKYYPNGKAYIKLFDRHLYLSDADNTFTNYNAIYEDITWRKK